MIGTNNPFEPPQTEAPTAVAMPEVVTARDAWAHGARLMAGSPLVSLVWVLSTFLVSMAPAPYRGLAVVATASILQPFEIEWWTARERGGRPDFGRALSRLPMVLAMDVVVFVPIAIGLLLLIVPGLYLTVRFAFVANLVVLEGHGWSSLAASRDLALGRSATILGVLLPALLVSSLLPIVRAAAGDATTVAIGEATVNAVLHTWTGAAHTALFLALSPRHRARGSASVSALRTPAAPR